MDKLLKHLILFALGGIFYVLIELLWRGYSHWSMFVLGGVCFVLLGLINEFFSYDIPLVLQMLIGAFVITSLEFLVGYIVNIKLQLNVWDYSYLPFNIKGQVCLQYTIFWFFISCACIVVDDWLRYLLFDEEKPHYRIF